MKIPTCAASKGRPREFDVDQALTAALRVFWSKGYEGASLTDLTEAMGITRPSLYAAFGNKESLFCKTLDLYEREKLCYIGRALEAPTARGVAEALLRGALERQRDPGDPRGCMGVINSVACGVEAESIREEVLKRGESAKQAITARFERARQEGDLPPHADPEGLTSYVIALVQGIALQGGSGASCADLERLVQTSLTMWPTREPAE
ncbi:MULTISPECIES: TetR/AcrR family transcriptional regulator [unclassified Sphingomonas]|uniref:TetR/AcrR family transcriptional regulator n=1 Tax=unclassified Sphingomonas TaxID=196159 RepID=UPI0002FE005C|nr:MULTISPECIES: TetR/AcrR family transcriptional regulator [unclassified Sphingomonas]KTF70190.1 TetR family transcriptional regulator [Sphingomonas sp. WG]